MRRKIVDGKKDLLRRLLQGMGRIGRREEDFGVGILLFDPEQVLGKQYSNIASNNRIINMKSTKILEQTLKLLRNKKFARTFV